MTRLPEPELERAARSWVHHVRSGGATPWTRWLGESHRWVDQVGSPAGLPGEVPGAAQLEFVRRLAERRTSTGAHVDFEALADLALHRAAPGRGMGHLRLLHAGGPAPVLAGPPPVDPARIPARELVRVGAGTLADLLRQDPPAPERRRRRRPWSKSFRLTGAPVAVAGVRAALAAAGRVEGGRTPEVVVLAAPFGQLLGQVWSARVQRGAAVRWPTFVNTWAEKDALPPSAALLRIAERWAERVGPERVHIVVTRDLPAARRTVSEVLRLPTAAPDTAPEVEVLSPTGVEVVRLVNDVLNVHAGPEGSRALVGRLARLVRDDAGTYLDVPDRHRAWARHRSEEIARRLGAGGYAVHGDLGQVVLDEGGAGERPSRRAVLDLMLEACLRAAPQQGRRREVRAR